MRRLGGIAFAKCRGAAATRALWSPAMAPAVAVKLSNARYYLRVGRLNEMQDEIEKAFRFKKPSEKQLRRRRNREQVVLPTITPVEGEEEGDEDDEEDELKSYLKLRKVKEDRKAAQDPDVVYPESDAEFSTDDEFEMAKKREAKRPLDEKGRRMWEYRDPKQLTHISEDLQTRLDELVETLPAYDRRIAVVRLKLALQLYDGEHYDSYKIVSLAKDALKVFGVGEETMEVALCLYIIGCGYRGLEEYEQSLSFLQRSLVMLERMEEHGKQVVPDKRAALSEIGHTLVAQGKTEQAVEYYHHSLDLLQSMLEPDSPQLGDECRDVAEHCYDISQWNDAKEVCERAIRIHCKSKGHDSADVAKDRGLLGNIYSGMGHHDRAIEQYRIARQIYLDLKGYKGAFVATLWIAEAQMALNRLSEAVATLECAMVPRGEPIMQGLLYISLAKAFLLKKNKEEARKQVNNALKFYKMKKPEQLDELADQLMQIASIFDKLDDKEQSLAAMKQAMDVYRSEPSSSTLTVNIKVQLAAQLVKYGRAEEALAYYRQALETFDTMEAVSPYLLNMAAEAYMEAEKLGPAVELLEKAKEAVGPPARPRSEAAEAKAGERKTKQQQKKPGIVPERRPVLQNLVKAYTAIGRHADAVREQESVVEELLSLKEAGQDVEEALKEQVALYGKLVRGRGGSEGLTLKEKAQRMSRSQKDA